MNVWMLLFQIIRADSSRLCLGYFVVPLLVDIGHSFPALASEKRTIEATDGLSSSLPWWAIIVTPMSRNAHNQWWCVCFRGREKGRVLMGRCEQLCVSWRPKVHPRTNDRAGGRCKLTLLENKPDDTHLEAAGCDAWRNCFTRSVFSLCSQLRGS